MTSLRTLKAMAVAVAGTLLILTCDRTARGGAVEFRAGEAALVVAAPTTDLEARVVVDLTDYLGKVLGHPAKLVASLDAAGGAAPAIVLSSTGRAQPFDVAAPTGSPESFALETRTSAGSRPLVLAVGNSATGLKRAVRRLIVKSEQREPGLVIPDIKQSESPWIPKREWTLCPWGPELVRGYFVNPNVDKRLNVWNYSDRQIADYVAMFDAFGFSGAQLMDTPLGYAVVGSAEGYQDRIRKFAEAADARGQDVTLWVWAAQFNDYGWFDPDVTYAPAKGTSAYEDPKVRATFERYYDGYARLAPHVDLLIAHFYDPGQLNDRADVFNYMRLLYGKFKAQNPDVRLGVDFWASGSDAEYMRQLIDNGFGDALLLENSMPHTYGPGKREALHEEAKKRGVNMGVWGWYTVEMESDQMPMMHVNARVLADFYRAVRDGADRIRPLTYWSEMEAYHLANVFTMYAAGQLLWNPDRDPDEVLHEIADGILGPRNGADLLAALKLIQDVRSGPTWDTYWWKQPAHRLGTADPKDDLRRADESIAKLEAMRIDPAFVPKFPLPFPPRTFVEVTLPNLRQIRHFADFRVKCAAIREAAAHGAPKDELARLAKAAWDPVPEYDTWIGAFGQPEAATQEAMMLQLVKDFAIDVPVPAARRWLEAERLLQAMQNQQRTNSTPLTLKLPIRAGFNWTADKTRDRFQLLLDNGCVERIGQDQYHLTNWEEYRQR
jgi:hypothetical protein